MGLDDFCACLSRVKIMNGKMNTRLQLLRLRPTVPVLKAGILFVLHSCVCAVQVQCIGSEFKTNLASVQCTILFSRSCLFSHIDWCP